MDNFFQTWVYVKITFMWLLTFSESFNKWWQNIQMNLLINPLGLTDSGLTILVVKWLWNICNFGHGKHIALMDNATSWTKQQSWKNYFALVRDMVIGRLLVCSSPPHRNSKSYLKQPIKSDLDETFTQSLDGSWTIPN